MIPCYKRLDKPIKVRIEGIGKHGLRTRSVEGITYRLPKIGEGFVMMAESLAPEGDVRYIHTSLVKSIDKGVCECKFHTENSTYKLEILEVL